jgi:hypothetical protein
MSYGVLMCSKCKREIHQDGPNRSWQHCPDKTPICQDADKVYVDGNGIGVFCNRDYFEE